MTSLKAATFLVGVGVGLAVAVPIGPMGILCIQRTVAFGLAAGLAIGLAAATVHVAYSAVAVFGLSATVMKVIGAGAGILSLVSAAILFWFAIRVLRREVLVSPVAGGETGEFLRFYRDALAFGFSNPLTVILFFAAFPALATTGDLLEAPVLVSGVFAGSIGWFVVLSSAVALLRNRLSVRALNLTNKASGLALAGLGTLMVANAFGLGPN
jgi:threonine/homoserine/homoserine lactone efflux protein